MYYSFTDIDNPDFRSKVAAAWGGDPPNARAFRPSPTLPQTPGGSATFYHLLSFTNQVLNLQRLIYRRPLSFKFRQNRFPFKGVFLASSGNTKLIIH